MKLRYVLILCMLALGTVFMPSGNRVHAASYTLSGHVYGMDGGAATGVTVCAHSTDPNVSDTCFKTFNNSVDCGLFPPIGCPGGYRLSVPQGQYNLKIKANPGDGQSSNISSHFSLTTFDALTVNNDQSIDITIPGHLVTVHVGGYNATDLQGADLSVDSPTQADTADHPLKIAGLAAYGASTYSASDPSPLTTDSQGNASFWVLPSSENTADFAYTVSAQPPTSDYGAQTIAPFAVTTTTYKSVILPQAVTIAGNLTDGDGNPATGVTVGVENAPGKDYVSSAATDSNGHYSFKVGPGNYYLKVTASRGGSQAGAASEVLLETSPSPVPTASDPNTSAKGPIPFTTSNTGLNIQLPEHKITLNVTYLDQYNFSSPTVQPFAGASISTASNCPLLNFTVDGYPATACSSYREANGNNHLAGADDLKTDSAGVAVLWLFDNTPYESNNSTIANPYALTIDPHGGYKYNPCVPFDCTATIPLASYAISNITLSSDLVYNIRLQPPVRLSGQLFAGDGTTPAGNVTVGVETSAGSDPIASARTDGSGNWHVDGLTPDADYYLKISAKPGDNATGVAPSFTLGTTSPVHPTTSTDLGSMVLPEHQVNIQAVDGSGNGVSGVKFDAMGNCPSSVCSQIRLSSSALGSSLAATLSAQYPQTPDYEPATDGGGNVTLWLADDVQYQSNATPDKNSNFLPTIVSNFTDTRQQGRLQQVFVVHAAQPNPYSYTLALTVARTVSGTVNNGDGSASQGVTVTFRAAGGSTSYTSSQTDASGKYSVKVASGQQFTLSITATGNTRPGSPQSLLLRTGSVGTISADTTINLTLPTYYVTITVNDHTGSPIQNATVDASAACLSGGGRPPSCQQSNMTVTTSLPSPYNLVAATGSSSYASLNDAGTNPRASAATDSSGNAHMWLLQSAPYSYVIHAYPPNGDSNNVPATLAPNLQVTGDTSATVQLGAPVTVSGTLSDNHGGSAAGVSVSFLDSVSGKLAGSGITDTSGTYTANVPAGTYYVKLSTQPGNGSTKDRTVTQADAPQYLSIQTKTAYTISTNAQLNLTIPEYRVSMTVLDPSGAALAGAVVDAANACPQISMSMSVTFAGSTNGATPAVGCSYYQGGKIDTRQVGGDGKTDSAGHTQLWLLKSSPAINRYNIVVHPPTATPNVNPGGGTFGSNPPPTMWPTGVPALALSADTTLPSVTMLKIITVSGTLSDGHGHPAGGLLVGLESKVGSSLVARAKTASDGTYSFTVGEGTYFAKIIAGPGAVPAKPAATYSGAPQYLTLETIAGLGAMHANTTLNLQIPEYQVTVTVRNRTGTAPVSNVVIGATSNCPHRGFTMTVVQAGVTSHPGASGCSSYSTVSQNAAATSVSGQAALWLLPTAPTTTYNITAYPAASAGKPNSLPSVPVTADTTASLNLK